MVTSTTGTTKLFTSEVYNKIRPLMCSINTPLGESSGFFLKDGVVMTVAHNIFFDNPNFTQINYLDDNGISTTFPSAVKSIDIDNAKVLDLFAFETDIHKKDTLPILPETVKPYEGMKVYFAGFPLGNDKITFHKGVISSLSTNEQGVQEFTIDGTVVPGNSGGPIVVVHEGTPHLIGVITSEMSDFSPEDLKTIAIMQQLKLASQAQSLNKAVSMIQFGGATLDAVRGIGIQIAIETVDGKEQLMVYDRDVVGLALDLIQRNLSTGIGKAIDIRAYKNLTNQASLKKTTGPYFFPTKGKKPITGNVYGQTTDGKKIEKLKYMEVRYGIGKGPRGIRFVMSDSSGAYTYKFLENPHTSPGNYNKNQNELYDKAAIKFANIFLGSVLPNIPNTFAFDACGSSYKAEKQV